MTQMQRRHYEAIAEIIRTAPVGERTRKTMAKHAADRLQGTNPNFHYRRFVEAATGEKGGR